MKLRSEALERWWPTTQSLDLVEGWPEQVADALQRDLSRYPGGASWLGEWTHFVDLDAALATADGFANVPTVILVLPTRSRWSVLWNNSFLFVG
jgi:hypothetical protein